MEVIVKLKSCLWAVGNIGANDGGVPFLEKSGIVREIVLIAEQSSVISLKGYLISLIVSNCRTAYFVLGLISGTMEGVRILDELGWDSVMTTMGTPTGLCVPRDPSKFLSLPPIPTTPAPEPISRNPTDQSNPIPSTRCDRFPNSRNNNKHDFSSPCKRSNANITEIKTTTSSRFKRKFVWLGMLRCLEQWNYPLAVRRFLFEFFGQRGMIRAIGREEVNGGESEAEDSEEDPESEAERKPAETLGLIHT